VAPHEFYVVSRDQAEVAAAEYWTGDDDSVATVDSAGTVIAVAPGTVNVTAMIDSATGTAAFGQVSVTS
jgi:xanthine/uracil/vitamin C permease (AzgA family)